MVHILQERFFAGMKDESKKRSEGIWIRGKVAWDRKKIMQSRVENEPKHVIIHPVVPKGGDNRATKEVLC